MLSTLCLFVCLGILAVILRNSAERKNSAQGDEARGYVIARHVHYAVAVRNETNQLLEKAELWVQAPLEQTATQRLENLRTSQPHELIADDSGNQAVHLDFCHLPPYATKIVNVAADLMLSASPNPIPDQNLDA